MRGNLWDDPRVSKLCDVCECGEALIVGGLYWLWATADQHTEDGCMPGLTLRQIDRKTGIPGFAAALVSIGWLRDDPQGVVLANFEEHNGASAKKRAVTAKRVANHRGGNADVTPPALQEGDAGVTGALAREREEKRREEGTGTEKPARTRASPIARPDDVTEQTWGDWLQLRKTKRAPVSETVVAGARDEAGKAGMAFERFLQIWCRRGSQGLEAAWLRADERRPAADDWRTEQRTRTQQAAPGVAAGAPAAQFFIDAEAREVAPVLIGSST